MKEISHFELDSPLTFEHLTRVGTKELSNPGWKQNQEDLNVYFKMQGGGGWWFLIDAWNLQGERVSSTNLEQSSFPHNSDMRSRPHPSRGSQTFHIGDSCQHPAGWRGHSSDVHFATRGAGGRYWRAVSTWRCKEMRLHNLDESTPTLSEIMIVYYYSPQFNLYIQPPHVIKTRSHCCR